MKIPRHLIDKMLADGRSGEFVSMACLGAAMAIKMGEPPPDVSALPGDPAMPERHRTALKETIARAMADLKHATPEEVEYAITLYTEHLKAAGYRIEMGHDH